MISLRREPRRASEIGGGAVDDQARDEPALARAPQGGPRRESELAHDARARVYQLEREPFDQLLELSTKVAEFGAISCGRSSFAERTAKKRRT